MWHIANWSGTSSRDGFPLRIGIPVSCEGEDLNSPTSLFSFGDISDCFDMRQSGIIVKISSYPTRTVEDPLDFPRQKIVTSSLGITLSMYFGKIYCGHILNGIDRAFVPQASDAVRGYGVGLDINRINSECANREDATRIMSVQLLKDIDNPRFADSIYINYLTAVKGLSRESARKTARLYSIGIMEHLFSVVSPRMYAPITEDPELVGDIWNI